jgi:hypothetical protein
MAWIDDFKNPPAENRIKPFWFWNGDMDKKEIDRQLKEMVDKGLGGAFICARQGLSIPYLSKEWFELVKYAGEKAAEYGIETWLYDEYPYPSGMSGGEVLLKHPEAEHMVLKHRSLLLENGGLFEENIGWSEVLYAKAFRVREDKICFNECISLEDEIGNLQTEELYQITGLTKYNNKRYFSYRPEHVIKVCLPEGKWQVEIYLQQPLGDFKYYGKFFDPCAREAVKTFLDTTHERYKAYMGKEFGGTIHGMFSDEVGLLSPIPWSKRLPQYFMEDKGYDILDHLPALHCASYPDAYRIRYDLYDAIHRLFVDSYHKQNSEWCKTNHLEYATEVPSMRMTTQQYSTIVGGDTAHEKLGKPLEWIYDTYIHSYRSNAKAVSSLTRQLGQKFAMIESFHSVGWSMTLQDAKWMFDRLGASGINFFNVHAFYYTIDSITKHDAPPSQFFQNPYWKHYKKLADYAGRLSVWVTNTEADISVAVLDPVAALWAYLGNPFFGFAYKGEDESERIQCDNIRNNWVSICKELLFHHIDYEHLDAEMLEEAEISEGKIRIGRAVYRVLVIPPAPFLENKAYQKIIEFAEHGGKVVSLGMLPHTIIDCDQKTIDWGDFGWNENPNRRFFSKVEDEVWCDWCREAAELSIDITIHGDLRKDIISSVRMDKENHYVFLANQGSRNVSVTVHPRNMNYTEMYVLSLDLGNKEAIVGTENQIILKPYESRLICCSQRKDIMEPVNIKRFVLNTTGELPVSIDGQNILRLDNFQMSKDRERWHEVPIGTFIEQCANKSFLDAEDFQFTNQFGTPRGISIRYPFEVYYKTEFEIDALPERIGLLMDRGAIKDTCFIRLNGNVLEEKDFHHLFVNDQNNHVCDIRPFVGKGVNRLEVKVLITKDSDGIRDPLYLYGDFGVDYRETVGNIITKKPDKAFFNLNYIEGFPFYSGTLRFKTSFNVEEEVPSFELSLDIEEQCHDCLEILINGVSLGARAFSPYVWYGEGSILKGGKNDVEIRLTNTLAAMLDGSWFNYEKDRLEYICKNNR